ncbi:6198_t:CDS:2 [Scutellospora calospora]|uniref:6198_t:CDS:1 n=1 Tax=Scutellospora calospora TaxID=85575 RepID=A0ACA9L481_9GLOM|nr:6198_t:CDS:2 [Scutellospora calospora]
MNIELTPTELMEAELEDLIEMQQYIIFEACKETGEENQYTAIYDIQSEDQNDEIEKVNNNSVDRENYTVIKKPRIMNIEVTKEDILEDLKFDIWKQVEVFFAEYEARNRFSINKYRIEHSKTSEIQKRTFICEFGITTFINKHNHKLLVETREFEIKFRLLSEDALKEIEIMTKHANLLITVQRSLLKARFPDLNFQDTDLDNAIQKFKRSDKISEENIVFSYKEGILESDQNGVTILPIHKLATMPTIVSVMKNTIHKRQQYGRIWRLVREATLLAVENNDDEIVPILRKYISEKKNQAQSNAIDQTIETPAE